MAGMIISVLTNKGGVGKTTTAITLGHALAREGKQVLVVDLDTQSNATTLLLKEEPTYGLKNLMDDSIRVSVEDCISWVPYQKGLYCIGNTPDAVTLEPLLIGIGRDGGAYDVLRDRLREYATQNYDFTLIDCPPNHGIFVINALHTSDFAIVPTEAGSKSSVTGLQRAVQLIRGVSKDGNPDLRFLRLLVTKVDRRTAVSKVIVDQLQTHFGEEKMFQNLIPINTSIQRAELANQTVIKYDSKAGGARAYRALAKEFLSIVDDIQTAQE